MLRNYITVAFRNLRKSLGFTIINILGLSLGLVVSLLIFFYVLDELSYDRYNLNADRIYRINLDFKSGVTVESFAQGSPAVGEALVHTFPEVERSVRFMPDDRIRFKKGDVTVQEDRVAYCDSTLFLS